MADISFAEVLGALGPLLVDIKGEGPSCFHGVTVDSRKVGPGSLFIALRGERHDGHQFVAEAVARGAKGVIVSQPLSDIQGVALFHVTDTLLALHAMATQRRRRHPSLRVIGITGSVGKTTTKELTAAVLGTRFRVLKSPGNLNTDIGLPLSLLELQPEHEVAVLEMGMFQIGDIALLCQIASPHIGVITNVGPVHLERLTSIEAIASAKGELLEALPPSGTAVTNGDCPWTQSLRSKTRASWVTFGLGEGCEVRGMDLEGYGLSGFSFRLVTKEGEVEVPSPMPGKHNVYAALAASAVGLTLGMSLEEISFGLSSARTDLRLRVVPGPRGSTIIDDSYNASPPSVTAALDLLAELEGRRIALLGDMLELGPIEEEAHISVGRYAGQTVDLLVLVGAKAPIMAEAARQAGLEQVIVADSKEEAVRLLKDELRRGDYLLVKGSRALALEKVVEALTS